jgi:hypothetical protein
VPHQEVVSAAKVEEPAASMATPVHEMFLPAAREEELAISIAAPQDKAVVPAATAEQPVTSIVAPQQKLAFSAGQVEESAINSTGPMQEALQPIPEGDELATNILAHKQEVAGPSGILNEPATMLSIRSVTASEQDFVCPDSTVPKPASRLASTEHVTGKASSRALEQVTLATSTEQQIFVLASSLQDACIRTVLHEQAVTWTTPVQPPSAVESTSALLPFSNFPVSPCVVANVHEQRCQSFHLSDDSLAGVLCHIKCRHVRNWLPLFVCRTTMTYFEIWDVCFMLVDGSCNVC